jgi:hypothetical protein
MHGRAITSFYVARRQCVNCNTQSVFFTTWQHRSNILHHTNQTLYSLTFRWVREGLSLQLKRPERESDHLLLSSANVTKQWSPTSTLPIRLHVVGRDKFGFSSLRCDAGCERVPDDSNVRVALSKLQDKDRLPLKKNATKSFETLRLSWVSWWSCLHWIGVKYKTIRKLARIVRIRDSVLVRLGVSAL